MKMVSQMFGCASFRLPPRARVSFGRAYVREALLPRTVARERTPRPSRRHPAPREVQLWNEGAREWMRAAKKSSHRMIGFLGKRRIEE